MTFNVGDMIRHVNEHVYGVIIETGYPHLSMDDGSQKERAMCAIELNGLRAKINIGQTTGGSHIGR
ncbi:MAG: hypothetical protein RIR47_56 [Bacteroidota bacterium]|jgi:hypothetical protein